MALMENVCGRDLSNRLPLMEQETIDRGEREERYLSLSL